MERLTQDTEKRLDRTPEELAADLAELKILRERAGGRLPVHCNECELWGSNGWSQYQVGYCEGDSRPYKATDFCSHCKPKETPNAPEGAAAKEGKR